MMGWSIGYDENWKRDVGYGVPSHCDHLGCDGYIDRGISFVCGGEPFGGERGCGLYFCENHLHGPKQLCERCLKRRKPFAAKPDHAEWVEFKLADESWQVWRGKNPEEVAGMRAALELAKKGQP